MEADLDDHYQLPTRVPVLGGGDKEENGKQHDDHVKSVLRKTGLEHLVWNDHRKITRIDGITEIVFCSDIHTDRRQNNILIWEKMTEFVRSKPRRTRHP